MIYKNSTTVIFHFHNKFYLFLKKYRSESVIKIILLRINNVEIVQTLILWNMLYSSPLMQLFKKDVSKVLIL